MKREDFNYMIREEAHWTWTPRILTAFQEAPVCTFSINNPLLPPRNNYHSDFSYFSFYIYLFGCDGLVAKSCPTFVALWTVAHRAPPCMAFPRQEYGSGCLSFSREFLYPGIKPRSPALQADSLPAEPPGIVALGILLHVESSFLTRDQTWVPCIGSMGLSHWATREVPFNLILTPMYSSLNNINIFWMFDICKIFKRNWIMLNVFFCIHCLLSIFVSFMLSHI